MSKARSANEPASKSRHHAFSGADSDNNRTDNWTRSSPHFTASFGGPLRFVGIPPESGSGIRNKLWVAALDQVASLGDDVLQDFENLADTGFPVDDLGR